MYALEKCLWSTHWWSCAAFQRKVSHCSNKRFSLRVLERHSVWFSVLMCASLCPPHVWESTVPFSCCQGSLQVLLFHFKTTLHQHSHLAPDHTLTPSLARTHLLITVKLPTYWILHNEKLHRRRRKKTIRVCDLISSRFNSVYPPLICEIEFAQLWNDSINLSCSIIFMILIVDFVSVILLNRNRICRIIWTALMIALDPGMVTLELETFL